MGPRPASASGGFGGRLVWLMAALLLPGAVGTAPAPRVASIEVIGNRHVPRETILRVVQTRVGEPLAEETLRADRQAIQELGYFRAVPAPLTRTNNQQAVVIFRVEELPLVLHVRILGNSLLQQGELREVLKTRVGEVLCLPRLLADIAAIQRRYRERGYAALVAEDVLPEATRSGIVRYRILELTIAEVRFAGADGKLERRLRRAIQEVPGQPYRPAAVAADAKRLQRVRRVREAVPRAELCEPGTGKVRIVWHINPTGPVPPPDLMDPDADRTGEGGAERPNPAPAGDRGRW